MYYRESKELHENSEDWLPFSSANCLASSYVTSLCLKKLTQTYFECLQLEQKLKATLPLALVTVIKGSYTCACTVCVILHSPRHLNHKFWMKSSNKWINMMCTIKYFQTARVRSYWIGSIWVLYILHRFCCSWFVVSSDHKPNIQVSIFPTQSTTKLQSCNINNYSNQFLCTQSSISVFFALTA